MTGKFSWILSLMMIFAVMKSAGQSQNDTSSLLYAFKNGKISGHFRSFLMTTDNQDPLTDYYALALGGGLKYQTKTFKGFQVGIGGFFIWNIASSDLAIPDEITNSLNRYEIGQFDQTDPSNKRDLQRLEDFFIKYNFRKSFIRFGKQVIKTPFVNQQDGRMRPTGEQGFWAEINEVKKTKIELGWLSHISPRGTLKWYRGSSSVGIYPAGVNMYGTKSDYKDNLASKGIAIAGITHSAGKRIKMQAWDHFIENVLNTVLFQADAEFEIKKDKKMIAAIQYIHQHAVNHGGNSDLSKTYFDPSQKSNVYGLSAGYRQKNSTLKFNYSRITRHGRFLFPREWGREPLFTFLSRERNEGLGDVNAFSLNTDRKFFDQQLTIEFSAGYYSVPDVRNYRLNKYGMPSYYQFNIDVKYTFDGLMDGLNLELLYLYKARQGHVYDEWKYVINKVNMHQLNFIMNYIF
ncbi:MAG TPA: OprD family outer membrane porin [Chitinophagaceae bacterium]|nr:OprD family outer membrane porin [Chitinophagaceae bacterium]